MKKSSTPALLLIFIFIFSFTISFSQEKADSSKSKLKISATFSLNSNGISSIPAFSLGKPAIISSVTLAWNRFSYEPVLAYGLDMRAWFIDNWLRYKIIDKPSFELRTGVNFSTFFSEYKLTDSEIWRSERYFALELTGIYKFAPNSTLLLSYWNDRGQEEGSLTGHFFNIVGERTNIKLGNSVLLSATMQLFYIDYDGSNDGLFISPKISSSLKETPFNLFFQIIQALHSNITPFPGFRWNIGFSYSL